LAVAHYAPAPGHGSRNRKDDALPAACFSWCPLTISRRDWRFTGREQPLTYADEAHQIIFTPVTAPVVTVSPLTPLSKKKNNFHPVQPKEDLGKLLALLDFPATVEEHKLDGGLLLDLKPRSRAGLIGRQGQTLADLQYITNRIYSSRNHCAKVMGTWRLPVCRRWRPCQKSAGSRQ